MLFEEKIRWYRTSPGFEKKALSSEILNQLPSDYLRTLELIGPGEGFVANDYVRLFPLDELSSLNRAYDFPTLLPGTLLFGSNGGGEGFAFRLQGVDPPVVRVPFIPLHPDYEEFEAPNFAAFWRRLLSGSAQHGEPFPPFADEAALGKEVHEIKPLCFGGPPTPDNQTLVPTKDHIELCRFWNQTFNAVRERQGRDI
jgi:hypothetical protein